MLSYENLLTPAYFRRRIPAAYALTGSHAFLSFQDAMHYLIRELDWAGKTLLLPAFYCEATVADYRKHGLKVVFCEIDRQTLDVDVDSFRQMLRDTRPDLVLLYHFFGKQSRLYTERSWLDELKAEAWLITDCAHAHMEHHSLERLSPRHIYLDSTRKTSTCMMSHMLLPPGMSLQQQGVSRWAWFRFSIRLLFAIKTICLRLASFWNWRWAASLGDTLYGWHDDMIGSRVQAFAGFAWDRWWYAHMDIPAIGKYRVRVWQWYLNEFADLAGAGHVQIFDMDAAERSRCCFFFVKLNCVDQDALLDKLHEAGYWVEVLWRFQLLDGVPAEFRDWASTVVVLPLTINTRQEHIRAMAAIFRTHCGAGAGGTR